MIQLTLSQIKLADLQPLIQLREHKVAAYPWTQVDAIELTSREQTQIQEICSHLINHDTALMNEATIWSRAIYPLLLLAEQDEIEAWAEVSLHAQYPRFELSGVVDGVLGKSIAGRVESPYLVVIEAKKGIEAENPVFQLYGQLLAAAYQNWQQNQQPQQELYGCYTIGDTWKFLRAQVSDIETERPSLTIEFSREYVEKLEAELIFKLLKKIVSQYI
ncbi:MAG: hypothetical protein F6J87_20585 [Spirulina sp. SIO3F2]|nr:hypothetical protein [Spirulina sp. SIO3F2]